MNNNNVFLQLRQNTAENVFKNGSFNTRLQTPVTLNEGDTITLNKGIIDSRSSNSRNIVLETETTLGFSYYLYLKNIDSSKKFKDFNGLVKFDTVDNDYYVVHHRYVHNDSDYNVTRILKLIFVNKNYQNLAAIVKLSASVPVSFQYLSPNPDPTKPPYTDYFDGNMTYDLDYEKEFDTGAFSITCSFEVAHTGDFILGDDIINITSKDSMKQFNNYGGTPELKSLEVNFNDISGDYIPLICRKEIKIPAGSYTPTDFGQRVSSLMTRITDTTFSASDPIGKISDAGINTLLTTTNTIKTNYQDVLFVKASKNPGNFVYGDDKYVGASQFDLDFDINANIFQFNYLHTPMYNSYGDIVCNYIDLSSSELGSSELGLASSYSGILFHSFFSTDNQGNEINLWENVLGFDLKSLITNTAGQKDEDIPGSIIPKKFTYFREIIVGTNVTTGSRQQDVAVYKKTYQDISMGALTSEEIQIGTATEPIFATHEFDLEGNKYGYYLVEITAGMEQDLITNQNIHNNIFAIVGKYYQSNNYSYSNEADAVVYTHIGNPLTINSFQVRILDSNYEVPNDLGEDNSFFLQLNKQTIPALENQKNKSK